MAADGDDDALMLAAGGGDTLAFNRLVQRHAPRLFAVARRQGCSEADADDIVQDTFLRAWHAAGRWRPGGAQVSTWLYKVAVNRIIDHRRAAGRRPEDGLAEGQDFADTQPTPEQALGERQRLAVLQAGIAALPRRQRMALILTVQQGKTLAESAEILGCTEGAVEQLRVRARRALREQYRSLT